MKARAFIVLFLLSLTAVQHIVAQDAVEVEDDYDEEGVDTNRAYLIVHKYVKEETIVEGKNMTIVIDVYNAGSQSASDVVIQDSALKPAENFQPVDAGKLTSKFSEIPAGSKVEYDYLVTPVKGGYKYYAEQATVLYRPSEEEKQQVVVYSTPTYFTVLTVPQSYEKLALEVGSYVSLGFCRTRQDWIKTGALLGTTLVLYAGYTIYNSVSNSRVQRKRTASLKDLGLEEEKKKE